MKVKVNSELWVKFCGLRRKKGDLIKEIGKALDLYSGYLHGTLAVRVHGEKRELVNLASLDENVEGIFIPVFNEFSREAIDVLKDMARGKRVLVSENRICIY